MATPVNVTGRFRAKALASWGDAAPEWILVLADEVDRTSQGRAGERIGYAGSTVSQLLGAKVTGFDLPRIEAAVRGALMGVTVDCPELQEIPLDQCLWEQSQPRSNASAHRNQIWLACRSGCPHSRIRGGDDAAV